ncbi:hypothetical protein [Burkholderia pseudomallei]|uniref:hypothetical protein n=1 Tax=Burkholderia pseudomallei TaxID=28450 RepID=UPI000F2D8884|nr:hypothetical protein [Burkholderia pseudomallei]CAJ2748662.1 Uncharacterised protein [Burkholderia pseudomallei]CAJ8760572.1 Uncharacterised protein [Burkholderia pseudomallei]CAJ8973261.1 Uncharacterised protein [Burkholderia pseudomallei]VBL15693.1 Uncharacterised protein [Burkholderia pseudomallei]
MIKTNRERIAEYRSKAADYAARADALEAQEKAAAALELLKQGDVIRFNYGRGETRGGFTGEVRAVFDTDKGKGIKVIKGSGADEEIRSVQVTSWLSVRKYGRPMRSKVAANSRRSIRWRALNERVCR